MTSFETVIDRFFGKITDDMYITWTKEDTENDIMNILIDAIPGFEFPRCSLLYTSEGFDEDLTDEEVNILAILMQLSWLDRQINSVENIRMKYSGSDFKMSSQANHIDKLLELKQSAIDRNTHFQRLYGRRRRNESTGEVKSNWKIFRKTVYNNED